MPTRALSAVTLIAMLFVTAGFLLAAVPAEAQCLSAAECDALKAELQELRPQARALKAQIRELRAQIRSLPEGSPERQELREQARALRRELRTFRREEIRPLKRQRRQGCRNC